MGPAVHGESALYERFTLEAFQSGLSWLTILRKRRALPAPRSPVSTPSVVAGFGAEDEARLLADAGIVRNRAKIAAAVRERPGGAAACARTAGWTPWSGRSPRRRRPAPGLARATSRPTTPESSALAKALRRHGFVFVGPTTAYAAMQACGLVNDHLAGCHVGGGGVLNRPGFTAPRPRVNPVAHGRGVRAMCFVVHPGSGIMAAITLRAWPGIEAARPEARGPSTAVAATRKGMAPMAAMKPRTGDGPLEVTKEGRGIVMRVPLEGGGRLVVEMSATEASELGDALKAVAG